MSGLFSSLAIVLLYIGLLNLVWNSCRSNLFLERPTTKLI